MSEATTIKRWSRRIVHPRLMLETSAAVPAAAAIRMALEAKHFKVVSVDQDGVSLRRRPWFDWLATSPVESCVVWVRVVGTGVELDVEKRGGSPAPERVAAALTEAVRRLRADGVEITWQGWEAVA